MRIFIVLAMACGFVASAATAFAFLLTPAISSASDTWVYVATLSSITDDGIPHRVALKAERRDAWTRQGEQDLGFVFIRRIDGPASVLAFRQTRFGAWIRYDHARNIFTEGCWGMTYDINGRCLNKAFNAGDLRPLLLRLDGDAIFVNLAFSTWEWR